MSLNALQLVAEFCALQGLPVPTALVGASDKNVAQYRAILHSLIRELNLGSWEKQKIRSTFAATAAADQGLLTTLFPGYVELVRGTLWSTTNQLMVTGPVTDPDWAAIQAMGIEAPPYTSWIAGGHLYISPTPTAGEVFAGTYLTNYGFTSNGSPAERLQTDSDTLNYPDEVVLQGFEAEWKKRKGLPYAADYTKFQEYIAKSLASTAPDLSLEGPKRVAGPGIIVPPGSWVV